jgi:hypothetical protein
MRRVLVAVATVLLVTGCATASTPAQDRSVPDPYDGPMSLPPDFSDDATPLERSGAAGRALECDGAAYGGGAGDYGDGLESVQDSPESALADWLDNEAWAYQLPESGSRVERDDGDRVLLSYDVADRTRIAFIAADHIRDYNDDEGWGIESWAQCDPSELPAAVTDALGIGVWQNASGRRVPVSRVSSFQGAEHCDWQDITFLTLDPGGDADQYLRDVNGELAQFLETTYDSAATLPRTATDTGLHRDGRRLWLSASSDAAYLVSGNDRRDVERWPAAKESIACA